MDAVNMLRRSAAKQGEKKMVFSMSSTFSRSVDSVKKDSTVIMSTSPVERILLPRDKHPGEGPRFIFRSSLGDSLSSPQIDSAYRKQLYKARLGFTFTIISVPIKGNPRKFLDSVEVKPDHTNFVVVGLGNPVAYQAMLSNTTHHILGQIAYPILVSFLLIALTTASFVFLYRNLLAQRRLTDIKNDFISNITHELKTPIATVNVAIEALKSFNAIDNPERTKEYLDISSSELQRLSLLVDKVLKLSLFENKDVELKPEHFSLKKMIEEVLQTMQLQFNKAKATVQFSTEGQHFDIEADKLHLTSVIYNLVDNALKYSPVDPSIGIVLKERDGLLQVIVSDNGIGIPAAYQDRIFDKFFRVPHGNKHNIKGYGLGLSYVSHIIKKHHGSIEVDSMEDKGSTFIISLPVRPPTGHENGKR